MNQETMSPESSLDIISQMIKKAKNSYLDDGFGPMLWGFTIVFCSLLHIIILAFKVKGITNTWLNPWLLVFIAGIIQTIYSIKENKKKLAKSWNDTAMSYVWGAFAITMFLGTFIKPFAEHLFFPNTGTNSIEVFSILLLYGTPTFITGGIMKFKPMIYGGIICFLCAFATIFVEKNASLPRDMAGIFTLSLTGIAAAAAWLIPGIILRLKYNKAKANNYEQI